MSNVGYVLVFEGELVAGLREEEVKRNLTQLFKLSEAKVDALFQRERVTLKRNLTLPAAQYMQKLFADAGVVVTIFDSTNPSEPSRPVSMPPATTPAPTAPVAAPVMRSDEAETAWEEAHQEVPSGAQRADPLGSVQDDVREQPFEFHGQGGEYFRIWIVNVLLSILTLGIYSAWAKVRSNRYFYSNTEVAGQRFSYLADPIAILKGRLLAAVLLIVYLAAGEVSPVAPALLTLLFLPLFPWLVVRAMTFRNQMTAYRYVHFGFDGGYRQAFAAFILWPIAGVFTFGLMMPYAIYKQKAFLVGQSRYGKSPFEFHATWQEYFKVLFIGGFIISAGGIAASLFAPLLAGLGELAGFALIPIMLLGYLLGFAYINASTTNILYNSSLLGEQSFSCEMQTLKLAGIQLTNWLMIAFTAGLAYPWAKVRMARYKAACLALLSTSTLESFVAEQEEASGSFAEGMDDLFDMDVGI